MNCGTVTHVGNNFKIEFRYHPEIVKAVKELPERRFNYEDKSWSVPVRHRDEVERFCKRHGLQFGQKYVEEVEQEFVIPPLPDSLPVEIPLKMPLRKYQIEGVAYSIARQRVIMADDMGLGKTVQAIATISGLSRLGKDSFPCLIVCPSAVKENWKREIEKWTNHKAIILVDSVKTTFPEFYRVGLAQFFIVNYESLKKYFVERIDDPGKDKNGRKRPLRLNHIHFKEKYVNFFKSIICDESHKLKSAKTQNAKFVKGITNEMQSILLLTGTPVINKPVDLIAPLGILKLMQDFGGYRYFRDRYCSGPKEASNLKELNYKMNTIGFYRRNKTDPEIKKYLPDKARQYITCELDPAFRKEYNHAQANLESYLSQYKGQTDEQVKKSMKGQVMVTIGILKNISARGKLKDAFSFIQNLIEQGEKVVVFANLTEIIDQVQAKFPKSVRVTGRENDQQKQVAVDKFQKDPNINLIALNLKAGGVGIDGLQNVSSQICFIEFGWHAAIMDQAEDRLFRSGQQNNVMCTYFLGKDTIDKWNYELIESKRDIANTIVGAEDETEVNIIDGVINLFNNP